MNGYPPLLPLILLTAGKSNQKALIKLVTPSLIPGSSAARLLVATISARQQIESQTKREQTLVTEAITASKTGKLATPEDLATFPTLDAVFKTLPATVQSTIFSTAPAGGGRKSGGNET
jgi:hypothetical protein